MKHGQTPCSFCPATGNRATGSSESAAISQGKYLEDAMSFLGGRKSLEAEYSIQGLFPVVVDCSKSLTEMINAGKYDWTSDYFEGEKFPMKESGMVERTLMLCRIDRWMSSHEALKTIEMGGLEPATIQDLLAFGAKYPEEQCKNPIVALGSSAKTHARRDVPYLTSAGAERRLYLIRFDYIWIQDWRFLVREKVSAT